STPARPSGTAGNSTGLSRGSENLSNSTGLGQGRGTGITELGSQPIIEASATSAGVVGFGREPIFFHLDEDEHALIPAGQIATQKLHPSGDTIVEVQLHRLRLGPGDAQQFGRFASGGIYLDMQQQAQAARQGALAAQAAPTMPLASSILS